MSEMMVRQQHRDAAVVGMLEVFQKAAAENPAFGAQLAQQRHRGKCMFDQTKRMKAMKEDSDPVGSVAITEAGMLRDPTE